MTAKLNVWQLQEAQTQFAELVRRARIGEPQHVALAGEDEVVVIDPKRFEVRPKPISDPSAAAVQPRTLAGFLERSSRYRARNEGEDADFDRAVPSPFRDKRREIFDGDFIED